MCSCVCVGAYNYIIGFLEIVIALGVIGIKMPLRYFLFSFLIIALLKLDVFFVRLKQ